ncbi:uncharacterized protein SAPINGB_P000222 [Magnusiomyces paraingens]|uniref:TauD/TfdA-like domain-containing protein n=1 Tax=Magnusiomyces paraingens TaxID=2606893 RepID=A0A5E8B4W7_9ASCO|nr:uncharacterized protein SAPINGB_P000222 [Saprochaete ingens]VVT43940.1 unnamed protein product [Saprochaete ingens]
MAAIATPQTSTITLSLPSDVIDSNTSLKFTPIPGAPLGAVVTLPDGVTDPSLLNDKDFDELKSGLLTHSVLVIPGMEDLHPTSQYNLTKRMDPTCGAGAYGHAKEFRHNKSVLRRDGVSVPYQPQVQVLGQGKFEDHCGMDEITLRHPTHFDFHNEPLTDKEVEDGYTRFYRWHIDSALYGLSPPVCTTLLGIHVPDSTKTMKIKYEDTGDEIEIAQAGTAFMSTVNAFENLSEEDKQMVLGTTVEYAPHPYIFISPARATSDGLTMVSEGKETPFESLPEWEESKVKKLPMVWTNPITGRHHLQVHGCCVYKLHLPNGKVLELEDARKEVHRLMRPAINPSNIYVHAWKKGDLALFHNQGVLHSVTGQFAPGERRLMHQCNIASGIDPVTTL